MNPLQRLIVGQMRRRGWSAQDVEDRGVKHATLHRYMNPVRLKTIPRRHVLEAIAAALDLSYEVVQAAAVATIDWDPATEDAPEEVRPAEEKRRLRSVSSGSGNPVIAAIHDDPYLLPEAKAHFLAQYQLLLRIQRDGAEEGRLPFVAEGTRTGFDPALEDQIDRAVKKAAKRNPSSTYRDRKK